MKIHRVISEQDKQEIKRAVEKAERLTSGQIVPAIVEHADAYRAAEWRFAFVESVIVTAVAMLVFPRLSILAYLLIEIVLLEIGLFLANRVHGIKRRFLHQVEIDEEVRQKALELFYASGVGNTEKHNGIMIFLSLLEKRVELVADSGIHRQTDQKEWDRIVQELVVAIKEGRMKDGLCASIEKCAEILSREFPKTASDTNTLSDEPIIG